MKKIYTLTTLLFLSAMLYAQLPSLPPGVHPVSALEVMQAKAAHHISPSERVDGPQLYVDYSAANLDDKFYVWRFNTLYVGSDTSMNYIGVAIDSIAGYTDPNDQINTLVNFTYPNQIRIDSIFVYSTHENNSGLYDKFTLKIATLNASNALTTTSSVLWQQTDSTNVTLSPGGNWIGTAAAYIWEYAPGYIVNPGTKVGIVWEYRDPTKMDTSSVLAGYVEDPGQPNLTAFQSDFKNSFMRYPPYIANISRTSNVGYGSPVGSGGWIECQNWGIWMFITLDPDLTAVIEQDFQRTGIRLSQNKPNPSKGNTEVNYTLSGKTNVTFEVRDVTGKLVLSQHNGVELQGDHTFKMETQNFNDGVYFYTIKTDGYSLTRKMIVMN